MLKAHLTSAQNRFAPALRQMAPSRGVSYTIPRGREQRENAALFVRAIMFNSAPDGLR